MLKLKVVKIIFSDNLRMRCLFSGAHRDALAIAQGIARIRGTFICRFSCVACDDGEREREVKHAV